MTDPSTTAATTAKARMGATAITDFISAFMDADDDADLEIRCGTPFFGGNLHVVITLNGTHTALSLDEAAKLADLFEDTMNRFPGTQEAKAFPNIIMGVRVAIAQIGRTS